MTVIKENKNKRAALKCSHVSWMVFSYVSMSSQVHHAGETEITARTDCAVTQLGHIELLYISLNKLSTDNLKVRDHLEDLGLDGRTLLKTIDSKSF
jgi:hypothetical protein